MNKANFLKITIRILIFIVIIFSTLISKNALEGYSCTDCVIERTLTGKWYDGWQKTSHICKEYKFDKESSWQCFNSNLPCKFRQEDIIQSEIKIPSIQIFNTILTSKNLPAFTGKGEGCCPSFAIDVEGKIYQGRGCLG